LRDAEKCKCNVKSGFPRAEARSYHGEYVHQLLCFHVRYGSMIHRPQPMLLASILPPPSGHCECYIRTAVMMPGAEAHIAVQSQNEILMMIDFCQYHPSQFRPCSMPTLNCRKLKPNWITYRIRETSITIPNHQWIPIPIGKSKLHCYRGRMAIDNRDDRQVVDGARNFPWGR
jgi:hypothetical protein